MDKRLLTLFSRTPVHVGAGNSVGVVDSPVMRERHTRIPIIPGSSLKGVLRDLWGATPEADWLFGSGTDSAASAGALLIGEARVLAFPVRSAKSGFAWITCPLALARFKRDSGADLPDLPLISDECCYAPGDLTLEGKVVLEEYAFNVKGEVPAAVAETLKPLSDDPVWHGLPKRLVLVSDGIFCYFVEHACEVVTRVRIDDETGTVAKGALFNQENVPSETMYCAVVSAQNEKIKGAGKRSAAVALTALGNKLAESAVIQVGGDETIGLGYCTSKLCGGDA